MINLELRLRVGDRDWGTGGDVHMGQHSIDELHILAWILSVIMSYIMM